MDCSIEESDDNNDGHLSDNEYSRKQKALFDAIKSNNFENFKEVLKDNISPNTRIRSKGRAMRCPMICVCTNIPDEDVIPYMEVLKSHGGDVECHTGLKRRLIHTAVKGDKPQLLRWLLLNGADVNARDFADKTALYMVAETSKAKQYELECLKILSDAPRIDLNLMGTTQMSPIHKAASESKDSVVEEILKYWEKGLELFSDNLKNQTPYQTISRMCASRRPQLENVTRQILQQYLDTSQQAEFCRSVDKLGEISKPGLGYLVKYPLEEENDHFMSHAIKNHQWEVVETLQKHNVPVDVKNLDIHKLCADGRSAILEVIMKRSPTLLLDQQNNTVLHTLISNFQDSPCYFKCLDILLQITTLDVDEKNKDGDTSLHLALKRKGIANDVIYKLIDKGAYLLTENKQDTTPLNLISRDVLEEYLNRSVSQTSDINGQLITFDFNWLIRRKEAVGHQRRGGTQTLIPITVHDGLNEMQVVKTMSSIPDLKPLLTHFAITAFMHLKWQRILLLFYLNLLFYALFSFTLSWHYLASFMTFQANNFTVNEAACEEAKSNQQLVVSKSFLVFFLIIMFLREGLEVKIKKWSYGRGFENYVEVPMIITTTVSLFKNCGLGLQCDRELSESCPQLYASGLVLAWLALVLLMGKHPSLSTEVQMLKTATMSVLKLWWFLPLLFGFGLSFYVLFGDCGEECGNLLDNPLVSFFKTFIMLTGELDASSLPYDTYGVVSYLIVVSFVILTTLILANLLVGIAVGDIKEVKDNAYQSTILTKIKQISIIENLLLKKDDTMIRFIQNKTGLSVSLFSKLFPSRTVVIKHNYRILFPTASAGAHKTILGYLLRKMDKRTVREAQNYLTNSRKSENGSLPSYIGNTTMSKIPTASTETIKDLQNFLHMENMTMRKYLRKMSKRDNERYSLIKDTVNDITKKIEVINNQLRNLEVKEEDEKPDKENNKSTIGLQNADIEEGTSNEAAQKPGHSKLEVLQNNEQPNGGRKTKHRRKLMLADSDSSELEAE